eukprot:6209061-Pleurochrysis_carterae.AAC.3
MLRACDAAASMLSLLHVLRCCFALHPVHAPRALINVLPIRCGAAREGGADAMSAPTQGRCADTTLRRVRCESFRRAKQAGCRCVRDVSGTAVCLYTPQDSGMLHLLPFGLSQHTSKPFCQGH